MFSGKSEELIRRLKRARIAASGGLLQAGHRPALSPHAIASHSAQTMSNDVANVARLREAIYGQLPRLR